MRKTNSEVIKKSLAEAIRLTKIDGFSASFDQLINIINIENDELSIYDDNIYQLYVKTGCDNSYFTNQGKDKEHFKLLTQFLLIDSIYRNQPESFKTLENVKTNLQNKKIHNDIINPWSEGFLTVIHQEHFTGNTWSSYAHSSDYEWDELHMLDDSLPYCSACLKDILYYLDSIVTRHSNDMAIPSFGKNITLKIVESSALQSEVEANLSTIVSQESSRRFLPSFIKGIINGETQKFLSCLKEYPLTYSKFCYDFLWALGAGCPSEESCIASYKQALDTKLNEGQITTREYLTVATRHQFKTDDIIKLALSFSQTATTTEDFDCLIGFLETHIEDNQQEWFATISSKIIQIDNVHIVNYLSHLIYQISEENIELLYSLLTKRFESLGGKNFLKNFWSKLIRKDIILFQKQLISWFSSKNHRVHSALLKLSSVREVDPSCFRLSEEILLKMESSDKLYIAMKIAGYMYSMEHLQNLMISLTNSVKKEETELLQHLYDIFYFYVIYNYRTILDSTKEEQKKEQTPQHIIAFYIHLEKAYNAYFHNLSLIKHHPELSQNELLSQHIHYYKQQQFSSQLKDADRNSFLSSLKNTPIHSKRWAIRRPTEKIHKVSPLGNFGVSVEFPSGEIFNPVGQEAKRRFYQNINRNEININ